MNVDMKKLRLFSLTMKLNPREIFKKSFYRNMKPDAKLYRRKFFFSMYLDTFELSFENEKKFPIF